MFYFFYPILVQLVKISHQVNILYGFLLLLSDAKTTLTFPDHLTVIWSLIHVILVVKQYSVIQQLSQACHPDQEQQCQQYLLGSTHHNYQHQTNHSFHLPHPHSKVSIIFTYLSEKVTCPCLFARVFFLLRRQLNKKKKQNTKPTSSQYSSPYLSFQEKELFALVYSKELSPLIADSLYGNNPFFSHTLSLQQSDYMYMYSQKSYFSLFIKKIYSCEFLAPKRKYCTFIQTEYFSIQSV